LAAPSMVLDTRVPTAVEGEGERGLFRGGGALQLLSRGLWKVLEGLVEVIQRLKCKGAER
jgi:hypothetical protein